jgi:aspartyl-tRNA(Asn)/glutamyl-tRNA(Gln) amidotransferase subunit A
MTNELIHKSAEELSKLLASREISSEELTNAFLEQIDTTDKKVGAFLTVTGEVAQKTAKEVDKLRSGGASSAGGSGSSGNSSAADSALGSDGLPALAGVPVAIKDIVVTKGIETTAASKILEGWIPPYDATIVTKMKANYMPILGKTNLDEFAVGSSNEYSAYKRVHNPWDLERTPGGSGGGSASAVAASMAPLAIGSDTGGSIRQPSSFTGTVGVKPTYGGVSRYGSIELASSLDQLGPVAKTVMDAALLQEVIGGYDAKDSTSLNYDHKKNIQAVLDGRKQDLSNVTVGIIHEMVDASGVQKGVTEQFTKAVGYLKDMGANVVEVQLKHQKYALPAYYLIMPAEMSSNLARYDGMRYGIRVLPEEGAKAATAEEVMSLTRGKGFGSEVKRRIILGTYALSSGHYDVFYGGAQRVRTLIQGDFEKAFEKCDVLISPTSPTTPFKLGEKNHDPLAMYNSDVMTLPVNLAGVAGMSIPIGLSSEDNLPVGFQLIATHMQDEKMYYVAAALEKAVEQNQGATLEKIIGRLN